MEELKYNFFQVSAVLKYLSSDRSFLVFSQWNLRINMFGLHWLQWEFQDLWVWLHHILCVASIGKMW